MTGTIKRETDSTVSICDISPQTYLQRVNELVELHLKAMDYTQSSFTQRRILWAANSTRPGFTATVALDHGPAVHADPGDPNQRVVGIAYGFPGLPTSWGYREVVRGLRSAGMSVDA
ncbi:MAG: N-acetyltransferase, partial [Corynebacterium variabile]|nr:N-acetyltransferase [Corynebacterium variabile]